jgi:hypothetical protein
MQLVIVNDYKCSGYAAVVAVVNTIINFRLLKRQLSDLDQYFPKCAPRIPWDP